MDLKGKKVTAIGLARSGLAIAQLTHRLGGLARISEQSDQKDKKDLWDHFPHKDQVQVEWGGHTRAFIQESDYVILSPGVRRDAPCVQWAKEKHIPVWGEIEFAYRFCKAPIVAVTGSNGKTTVSTLIREILVRAGRKVILCGNIGTPCSSYVLDCESKDIVVMEVSSFQLESIVDFRPFVAVFLNFSQNHLDRHKDNEEYFQAKKRIFQNQTENDFAVLNFQDPLIQALHSDIKSKVVYFNEPGTGQNGKNPNHLAALKVAGIFQVDEKISRQVVREFGGVEHRLEYVRCIRGVHFINDSKSTTAESGRWALESISDPIIMICGGRDKNINFAPLRDLVSQKVKKMILIGEAKQKLKNTFGDVVNTKECTSLKEAVLAAQKAAAQGDTVVLSPMCASFDMFKNFEERGTVFKELVGAL
ncbi:MAG: UDP-N-acetylmuramoyl-L-alanine--D-glutamate ligase [Candidatus Omnitrophota bacterium]